MWWVLAFILAVWAINKLAGKAPVPLSEDHPAPIAYKGEQLADFAAYRWQEDPTWLVRIASPCPGDSFKVFADELGISGITQQDVKLNVRRFAQYGKDRRLEVERQPQKDYPHALRVIGVWDEGEKKPMRSPLGWIPDHEARRLADTMPAGVPIAVTLDKLFLERGEEEKGFGFRITVWVEKQPEDYLPKPAKKRTRKPKEEPSDPE